MDEMHHLCIWMYTLDICKIATRNMLFSVVYSVFCIVLLFVTVFLLCIVLLIFLVLYCVCL
jgi:hypothetical protein